MKAFYNKIYDFRKKIDFIQYFKKYDSSFINEIPLRSIISNSLLLFNFTSSASILFLFKFISIILSKRNIIIN